MSQTSRGPDCTVLVVRKHYRPIVSWLPIKYETSTVEFGTGLLSFDFDALTISYQEGEELSVIAKLHPIEPASKIRHFRGKIVGANFEVSVHSGWFGAAKLNAKTTLPDGSITESGPQLIALHQAEFTLPGILYCAYIGKADGAAEVRFEPGFQNLAGIIGAILLGAWVYAGVD